MHACTKDETKTVLASAKIKLIYDQILINYKLELKWRIAELCFFKKRYLHNWLSLVK